MKKGRFVFSNSPLSVAATSCSIYNWSVVPHMSEGPLLSTIYIKLKGYELYESKRTMDLKRINYSESFEHFSNLPFLSFLLLLW